MKYREKKLKFESILCLCISERIINTVFKNKHINYDYICWGPWKIKKQKIVFWEKILWALHDAEL